MSKYSFLDMFQFEDILGFFILEFWIFLDVPQRPSTLSYLWCSQRGKDHEKIPALAVVVTGSLVERGQMLLISQISSVS